MALVHLNCVWFKETVFPREEKYTEKGDDENDKVFENIPKFILKVKIRIFDKAYLQQ